MNDLVVLDSGKVVDAVFRSRAATYTRHEQLAADDLRRRSEARRRRNAAPLKVARRRKQAPQETISRLVMHATDRTSNPAQAIH